MGLDLPLPARLGHFLARCLAGDLGKDVLSGRPVSLMVLDALPNTALLAFSAIFLAILAGLPLGAISALKPGGLADQAIAFLSVGFVSAPSFVSSIFLLLVFALSLHWFPVLGAGEAGDPLDQLWHVVLPAGPPGLPRGRPYTPPLPPPPPRA